MNLAPKLGFGSSAPPFSVTSYFQNLTNHSIMTSPWLALSSSNTNIISVSPNNQLVVMGLGTCTITASYLGYTITQTVTVQPARLSISLSQTNVMLFWPSNSATLQSSALIGAGPTWSPVSNRVTSSAGTNTALIPITNSAQYFRLSY